MSVFKTARENMVEGQIRPNQVIREDLIEAMRSLPREKFLPRHLQSCAYVDEDLPLGNGRYAVEPLVLARLVQAAAPEAGEVALAVGSCTGYAAALLGALCSSVVCVEENADYIAHADKVLFELDICNVAMIQGDMVQGYQKQAPYDVILINGAAAEIPHALLEQLADGGRLIAVISPDGRMGTATLITRIGKTFSSVPLFDAATPILKGFEKKQRFEFG